MRICPKSHRSFFLRTIENYLRKPRTEKWWFSAIFFKPERANNDFLWFLSITRTQPLFYISIVQSHFLFKFDMGTYPNIMVKCISKVSIDTVKNVYIYMCIYFFQNVYTGCPNFFPPYCRGWFMTSIETTFTPNIFLFCVVLKNCKMLLILTFSKKKLCFLFLVLKMFTKHNTSVVF